VQEYRRTYKGDPGLLEAYGFDAARMVRDIIEKQAPRSRGAFREAMATLKDFDGATGKTSFDEKREAQKPLFFLSVDSKGITELTPEKMVLEGT
jgi:branched-chain amino acid transport system substrate-binding protein